MAQSIMQNLEMSDELREDEDREQDGSTKYQSATHLKMQRPRNHHLQQDSYIQDFTITSPLQGTTIKTALQLRGHKIFSDASWKNNNTSGNTGARAGIGLFLQLQTTQANCKVRIQASTNHICSPLQAEALALVFAAKIANSLELQGVTFLTDKLTLAKAAAARSIAHEQVPWQIRNVIASFNQVTTHLQAAIYHINMNLNGEARKYRF
jgi:ribonuclease HI